MMIAHQCTTNMTPNPLVLGPQSSEMSYRSVFLLPPSVPFGYEFASDISVWVIVGWRKRVMRGGPFPFLVFVRLSFRLSSLRHLGLRFPAFLSSPYFESSCVDPGPPTPSSPRATSISLGSPYILSDLYLPKPTTRTDWVRPTTRRRVRMTRRCYLLSYQNTGGTSMHRWL